MRRSLQQTCANKLGASMIDVQLRPGVSGCITVPLGCLTLGLMPLLQHMGERHFIRQMDEEGVVTRGGTRIAWSEFKHVRRVISRMGHSSAAGSMSDEYVLDSPRGRVSLPLWRTVNAQEARDFALTHLPASLFEQQ
jgi:hypothetical protein